MNCGDRDARHSVHNKRTRGTGRGTKGSLSARDIRLRSRRIQMIADPIEPVVSTTMPSVNGCGAGGY